MNRGMPLSDDAFHPPQGKGLGSDPQGADPGFFAVRGERQLRMPADMNGPSIAGRTDGTVPVPQLARRRDDLVPPCLHRLLSTPARPAR